MSNNLRQIFFCPKNIFTGMHLDSDSAYFSYLSKMTISELQDIARESELRGWSNLKKADVVSFLKTHSHATIESLHKRIFPESLRAWVGLLVSDKSIAKHYTKIILKTLNRIGCLRDKPPKTRHRRKVTRRSSPKYRTLDIDDEFTYNFITNVYNDSDSESDY